MASVQNSSNGVDLAEPHRRAETYLRRVIALTGATQMGDYCALDVGKTRFHVYDQYVVRVGEMSPACTQDQTCFYVTDQYIPAEERIATALLQLRNNPGLFEAWVARKALFKADGHEFRFRGL
jgi:hypothetical protein